MGDGAHFTAVSRKFHDVFVDFAENQTLRLVVRSLVAVWTIQEQAWADAMVGEGQYPVVEQQHAVLEAHRAIAHLVARGTRTRWSRLLRSTWPRLSPESFSSAATGSLMRRRKRPCAASGGSECHDVRSSSSYGPSR